MKSTICPDCEGDEFRPCAICYKAMMPDNIDKPETNVIRSNQSMKLTDITEESTDAEVAQALTDNIVEKFKSVCPGPAIDKMSPAEIAAEADQFRNEEELAYWKHRCRIFEVLNRAADADLVEMKEKVARLEEQLMLSDYHKEGKGVF